MIEKLKSLGRFKITILLIIMSLFCFGISMARYVVTDTKVFLFLNWNLFLAFIPWLISSGILILGLKNRFSLGLLIVSWLLFFPNSPYILTDLFHLRLQSGAPIWFDLILILSFAWTGLVYGFISLMDMELLLKRYLNDTLIMVTTVLFLFLASFGIYLGRYLRWNSWDVLNDPSGLSSDIVDRFANPFGYPRAWGMTLLMGVLLNMMFYSIKFIKDKK